MSSLIIILEDGCSKVVISNETYVQYGVYTVHCTVYLYAHICCLCSILMRMKHSTSAEQSLVGERIGGIGIGKIAPNREATYDDKRLGWYTRG